MSSTLMVRVEAEVSILRVWRQDAGLSIDQMAAEVTRLLRREVSRETIRRYETGRFPAGGPDPWLVAAVAMASGRKNTDLPDDLQLALDDAAKAQEKLLRNRCFSLKGLDAA